MKIQCLQPAGLKQSGQIAWGARFSSQLVAAVAMTTVFAPCTFGQHSEIDPPKLNVAQKRLVWKLERQLVTPLNSKDNPGDEDTWYVILFTDTAGGARQSHSISGNVLTITRELQAARNSAAKIAHGRKEAALLLLQFGYSENTAAARLRPVGRGVTDFATAIGAKNWEYRALATEDEAKAFLQSITPQEKK